MNHMRASKKMQTLHAFSWTNHFVVFLTALFFLSFFSHQQAKAQGNLLINPRRVVFEGKKRIQEINLANTGKDSATYQISFKEIRMTEKGSFEEITQADSGQQFASKYLRLFPRRVTLAPNEAQVVKLQLSKTNQLGEGEYRSHLYFRATPMVEPMGEEEKGKESSELSVKLVPVFGITIPVFIQRGESTANVTLSDLVLEKGENGRILGITLNRTGNMSVYGDIIVKHISLKGKESQIGDVKGIAVYSPTLSRKFKINLENTPGVDYSSGKIHLIYKGQNETNSHKLAEAELLLH